MNTISETRDRFNLQSSMRGVMERRRAAPSQTHNSELLAASTLSQSKNRIWKNNVNGDFSLSFDKC